MMTVKMMMPKPTRYVCLFVATGRARLFGRLELRMSIMRARAATSSRTWVLAQALQAVLGERDASVYASPPGSQKTREPKTQNLTKKTRLRSAPSRPPVEPSKLRGGDGHVQGCSCCGASGATIPAVFDEIEQLTTRGYQIAHVKAGEDERHNEN